VQCRTLVNNVLCILALSTERNTATQCRCDLEVASVHLLTLATMVFVLQLIVNSITVKISVGFFWFPSNSKEFKKWEHLSRLNSLIHTDENRHCKQSRELHCVI